MSQAGQYINGAGTSFLETLTGNAGGAVGVDGSQNINLIGAGGVTITGNPSTNTLTVVVGGAGFSWNVISTSSAALVAENGYIVNNTGTCILTLPTTASSNIGDTIKVTGINNAAGWKIAQNASQFITFSTATTTTGTTGYLLSTAITDSVELVYVATNNWQVLSSIGNITYH